MKNCFLKLLKNVRFLILLSSFCAVFGQGMVSKKVVVIDVGHGGVDSGAVGVNGLMEKDVVLAIAKEMVRLNDSLVHAPVEFYLTRYTDTLIGLAGRSRLAKVLKANVFVSLHCNAAVGNSRGMEVYVSSTGDSTRVKNAIALGYEILKESSEKLGLVKRKVLRANFQVLRKTVGFCPSVLVELGFLSDGVEADYFLKDRNLRAVALAVLMGIVHFLKSVL